jgi:glycosyltransferase involved in cell wall biosynthesis
MPSAVSVICTFLNAEDTLEFTLESLRGQTSGEAEFTLVDDGSTDRSPVIAESFCARDPRFALHRNPDPGRGRALNLGVASTAAEFVAILDADDLAHPAWLADGIAALRHRLEFAVIGFERLYIRDLEQPQWPAEPGPATAPIEDVTLRLAHANVLGHSGVILRKAALAEVGGYDAGRSSLLDYDLWIRLAESGARLGISNEVRIAKRYHEGQKFAHMKGYSVAAWKEQLRAVRAIDPDYRNYLRLGLRVVRDATRGPRRTLASLIRKR